MRDRSATSDTLIHALTAGTRRRSLPRGAAAALLAAGLVVASAVPALAAPPEKVIVSDNAFLRSSRVEVGARPNATFGSTVASPAGWNPRDLDNSNTRIGFRYLRSGDWATGVTDGDFFLPGGPYEGWGIEVVGGTGFKDNTNRGTAIPGSFAVGAGDTEVVWTAAAPVDGIRIEQRYSVPVDGTPRLRMDVTFTNTTGSPLEVIYMRGVDADNCIEPGIADPTSPCGLVDNGYSTLNRVVSQRLAGDSRSAVASIGADGSVLVLWSEAAQSLAYFDMFFCETAIDPEAILAEGLAGRFSTLAIPFDDQECGEAFVTAVDEELEEDTTTGLLIKVTVPASGTASLVAYYELSGAEFGLGAFEGPTGTTGGGGGGPSWVPPVDGGQPVLPTGSGLLQRGDGTTQDLIATPLGGNQVRYSGDGIQVTFTGGAGTGPNGLVADENGEVECVICAFLANGGVIEAWMFSDPRLVAAWRVEDVEALLAGLPCQRFTIPVGAPLDGGGPIPVGTHTLQLVLPTDRGVQAVNVGVTVGRIVPTRVSAGEGPTGPMRLHGAVLVAVALGLGGLRVGVARRR